MYKQTQNMPNILELLSEGFTINYIFINLKIDMDLMKSMCFVYGVVCDLFTLFSYSICTPTAKVSKINKKQEPLYPSPEQW